jgi:hypothetical protein
MKRTYALFGLTILLLTGVLLTACQREVAPTASTQAGSTQPGAGVDGQLATLGAFEVTARLVEVPEGAVFKRELYDYATILKYEVQTVRRGQISSKIIYVGHYNPTKPRSEVADRRVKGIGGNLTTFQAGQVHHMALDVPIEDHFMGGIVNKYFGQDTGPIYWALWTNRAD